MTDILPAGHISEWVMVIAQRALPTTMHDMFSTGFTGLAFSMDQRVHG